MVYCSLKQKNDNSAVYLFGASLNDITGEVVFSTTFSTPQIIKQPKSISVPVSTLSKVAIKYRDEFSSGKFPNKLSYER